MAVNYEGSGRRNTNKIRYRKPGTLAKNRTAAYEYNPAQNILNPNWQAYNTLGGAAYNANPGYGSQYQTQTPASTVASGNPYNWNYQANYGSPGLVWRPTMQGQQQYGSNMTILPRENGIPYRVGPNGQRQYYARGMSGNYYWWGNNPMTTSVPTPGTFVQPYQQNTGGQGTGTGTGQGYNAYAPRYGGGGGGYGGYSASANVPRWLQDMVIWRI